jgi:DNA repair exonuclease SbcCD ATPase subunit
MFVEFTEIKFNNYKTIKSGRVTLADRGVILVQGVNNDKGGSNGAGKSSIANGLLWCLFDRTLVGKETEKEIIPKFTTKKEFDATNGCFVSTVFNRDGVSYRVIRHRKHPVHKNTVVVEQRKQGGDFINITKCTDKETNAFIEEVVGADFYAFVHSNIFSFNNIEPFLMRSDKDKKELVLPKYFIDMFKATYKTCNEKIKDVDEKLRTLGNDTLSYTIQISEKGLSLKSTDDDIVIRNKARGVARERLKAAQKNASTIADQAKAYQKGASVCATEATRLTKELTDCKTTLHMWEGATKELASADNKITTLERDINAQKLALAEYKRNDMNTVVSSIAMLSESADTTSKEYAVVSSEIEAIKKELEIKKSTLEEVLKTKRSLEYNLRQGMQTNEKIGQQISGLEAERAAIIQQKEDILGKYYSEACKICPSNKMDALFKSIDLKVEQLRKEVDSRKLKLQGGTTCVDELKNDIKEVTAFETEHHKSIETLEKGELITLGKREFALSATLHSLKNDIYEMKLKLNDADSILKQIVSIGELVKNMEEELRIAQFKASNLRKDCPEDNVVFFSDMKIRLTNNRDSELVKYTTRLTAVNEKRIELSSVEATVKNLEESLSNSDTELEMKREAIALDIKNLIAAKAVCLKVQGELGGELDLLKFWKIGFSPAGIEGFMMDSVVNAMNSLIAKYLGYLSGNTISLTLVPDSTLKSGDTRNKISEKVVNASGGTTYRTNSEGEKRIMDIAVLFALKYIYEQVTSTKYNILFMDEAFDTLDASTCSLVINLINTLDDITSLFVVSHVDAIALEFDTFIKVIKTDCISEIVDGG